MVSRVSLKGLYGAVNSGVGGAQFWGTADTMTAQEATRVCACKSVNYNQGSEDGSY